MSALPKWCRKVEDLEAYKAITKHVVGRWVRFEFRQIGGTEIAGKVTAVVPGRSTKTVTVVTVDGNASNVTLHPMGWFTMQQYRNEAHFKHDKP